MTNETPVDADAVARLAAVAEHRGGIDARREDGAFFTDLDVARRLAHRAIGGVLLDEARMAALEVDELLAGGGDLREALATRLESAPDYRDAVVERLGSLDVLDPTCGAGAFLHAAWLELCAFEDRLGVGIVSPAQLHGVDIDAGAVAACAATLELVTADTALPGRADLRVGDAERAGVLPDADVVVGNPPFVRAVPGGRAHRDLVTRSVANRSAWIVERALRVARPGGRVAFVLPISTSCTDAFAPARATWEAACDRVFTSHFDTIPSSLFDGVVQRISIFEGRVRAEGDATPAAWWTSRYHRWRRGERDRLLESIRHVPLPEQTVGGSLAKIGSELERGLLARLFLHHPAERVFDLDGAADGANRIHYKRRWSYFLLFTDFVPGVWDADGTPRPPSELKDLDVVPELDASALLAVYSSSLFWWYFSVFTDNRNVNRRDLAAFPLPDLDTRMHLELAALGVELMGALRECAEVRTCSYRSVGTIRNTYFRQAATRPVLDRIDRMLAQAYGLDEQQLAFVLAFERDFRGGDADAVSAAAR